jgi:hypothetical protein
MKCISLFGLIVLFLASHAQKNIDVTSDNVNALSTSFFNVVSGEPFVSAKFTKLVDGTPYFRNDWLKGNVTLGEGQQFAGVYIKLDLYNNEVHYRNENGGELIATSPIQKVILFDTAAQQVFSFVNGSFIESNSPLSGWYQLLVDGKILLLKKSDKKLEEEKPYGSATVEQSIVSLPRHYVLINKNLTEIKKLKDLPDILIDKKEEIVSYIKSRKFSKKNEGIWSL